jgi:hypothetical protein
MKIALILIAAEISIICLWPLIGIKLVRVNSDE